MICHLTTVHRYFDTRIFYRECASLQKAGFDVSLIASADEDMVIDGVKLLAIPRFKNRVARIFLGPFYVLNRVRGKGFKVIHFHDPELFFTGLLLRMIGKKVIFDVHENIAAQIRQKDWLPMRNLVSSLYTFIDFFSAKLFHLVLAEHSYEPIYKKNTKDYRVILNYPELSMFNDLYMQRRSGNGLFYIGGVMKERGIDVVLEALHLLHKENIDFTFHCVGNYTDAFMDSIKRSEAYKAISDKVIFYGRLDVRQGYEIAKSCRIGVSILMPVKNYMSSYSTKVFEYMAVGMPVITSDFELYRNVVNKNECGFCVDPTDATAIASAFKKLLTDEDLSHTMAMNGRKAVLEKYNWNLEEKKLIALYQELLGTNK